MINRETASKMAIKFFREYGPDSAIDAIKDGHCLDNLFERLVRSIGKAEVERLYHKLPEQLRVWVLTELCGDICTSLSTKLSDVYEEYDYKRISQARFLNETEGILLRYLRDRR